MEFWLQKEDDTKIRLPVKPSQYRVNVAQRNTVVNVTQKGDINLIGNTGLRDISLSSFFPAKDYNFSNNSDRKEPLTYVEIIEGWRKSGEPIRVIITGTLNMECTIESFNYGEQDATGDIYYTLNLKEYKRIKAKKATKSVSAVNTSSREVKSSKANSDSTYKVKSGDCLSTIAKKVYGSGSKANYMKIFDANTDKLSDPNKIQVGQVLVIKA